jgi:hypothetical protein
MKADGEKAGMGDRKVQSRSDGWKLASYEVAGIIVENLRPERTAESGGAFSSVPFRLRGAPKRCYGATAAGRFYLDDQPGTLCRVNFRLSLRDSLAALLDSLVCGYCHVNALKSSSSLTADVGIRIFECLLQGGNGGFSLVAEFAESHRRVRANIRRGGTLENLNESRNGYVRLAV